MHFVDQTAIAIFTRTSEADLREHVRKRRLVCGRVNASDCTLGLNIILPKLGELSIHSRGNDHSFGEEFQ